MNSQEYVNKVLAQMSPTKRKLLESCIYAIDCIDDSKVKPLKVDIEEDCAPIREIIEIKNCSIGWDVKVNGIDVIDENIEW